MPKQTFTEEDLAGLAKKYRKASGRNRAEAAREFGVSRISIINAEERQELSLTKLRIRMIEEYGRGSVIGPRYWLKRGSRKKSRPRGAA